MCSKLIASRAEWETKQFCMSYLELLLWVLPAGSFALILASSFRRAAWEAAPRRCTSVKSEHDMLHGGVSDLCREVAQQRYHYGSIV